MTEKIRGIILDIRKHNEKADIVTLLTPTHGRLVFISPISGSKGGRLRQSRLLPMAIIETEIRFRPANEFQRLGKVSVARVWKELYHHPEKRLITFFLADFLNNYMRGAQPDENIWYFIAGSLEYLDNIKEGWVDFHIVFLCSLLPFAGIQPDISGYTPGMIFDMREGRFVGFPPLHDDYLEGKEAYIASLAPRINFSNYRVLKLNNDTRRKMLQSLLHYYGIHYPGLESLKSLEILKMISI